MTSGTDGDCRCGDLNCTICGQPDAAYEMVIEFLDALFFGNPGGDDDEIELPGNETEFLHFVADNLGRIDLTRKAMIVAAQIWRDHNEAIQGVTQ